MRVTVAAVALFTVCTLLVWLRHQHQVWAGFDSGMRLNAAFQAKSATPARVHSLHTLDALKKLLLAVCTLLLWLGRRLVNALLC